MDDTDYDWVTFRTFHKPVATLIKNEVGIEAAQAQLGHGSRDVTRTYYVEPGQAPDNTKLLERFRPQ